MDDETCLDGNVSKLAVLKDDSKKLAQKQKDQDKFLEQNEVELESKVEVTHADKNSSSDGKEQCSRDVGSIPNCKAEVVCEVPFDEISSSQDADRFDLYQTEATLTDSAVFAGGQSIKLPDGSYGIIKHLTQMSDGFQFVSLEDGTLAWLATGMFAADGSISADHLELDTIDMKTDSASVGEEIDDQADPVMDTYVTDQSGSVDDATDHLMLPSTSGLLHRVVNRQRSSGGFSSAEPAEKTFKCLYEGCGRLYTTQHHLRVHQRSHTGDRPYVCSFDGCDKAFSTSYGLKSHRRIHTGEKPYICRLDGCEKAFKTSGDLQKHTRTHTGEKPFMCPYEGCNRSFTTSNIRKVHIRTHTGERPYTCDIVGCGKTFASATNYKNHIRIHSGEKPYVCTYDGCGKRFTEYSSLYKHHVVHTPSKPYECTDCGKTYRQTSTLAIHRRMVHSDGTNDSTTLVQSTATAYIVAGNRLCNMSGEVIVDQQPNMLSLRLMDEGVRNSLVEDTDGHLVIDTSDHQHHILSGGEGLQILTNDSCSVALDTVAMVASSSASANDLLGSTDVGRVYVINPLQFDSLALQPTTSTTSTKQLESIQRRAMKLIFGGNVDDLSRAFDSMPSLAERRGRLTEQFFKSLLNPANCLHNLMPAKRNGDVTCKLRNANQYPVPRTRTERYKKSTIIYGLAHYQQ